MHVAFATVCRPASQGGSREGQAVPRSVLSAGRCGQLPWARLSLPPPLPCPPLPREDLLALSAAGCATAKLSWCLVQRHVLTVRLRGPPARALSSSL